MSHRSQNASLVRRAAVLGPTVAVSALLAGCGSPTTEVAQPARSSAASSAVTPTAPPQGETRPMGHIHGLARGPGTGEVLLATHGGLFRVDDAGPTPVGPAIDLMGFAVSPDGSYLASGHPGPGVDLEQPVGLIRSDDGGRSWRAVSRAGQSDFHTLTAGPGIVAGFDGALRVGADGSSWEARPLPGPPHTLAASPDGARLLATTEGGLLTSDDEGRTWSTVATPELLVTVDWADPDTIVGVGVSGHVVLSEDGGASWTTGPAPVGQASAVEASSAAGETEVLVVVDDDVLRTTDLGASSRSLL